MNWHLFFANVVVFIHVLFVGIVVFAVPVILLGWWRRWNWVRNFWFRMIHLLMITIVVIETVFGVPCPLTVWEKELRLTGGQLRIQLNEDGTQKFNEAGEPMFKANKEFEGDFVGRLLHRIIFFEDIPEEWLEYCYYLFGVLVLVTLFLVPPRWPWKK